MESFAIMDVIRSRRSIRRFGSRSVEPEKVRACLDAARLAPSAENVQPWRFVVLDEAERRKAFGEAVFSGLFRHTRWALSAPLLIVLCAEVKTVHKLGKGVTGIPYAWIDIGIAGEHLILQAQAMGLGSCWIGWFHARKAARFLGLPRRISPCAIVALGYPEDGWSPRPRKMKEEAQVIFRNKWNE